MSTPKIPDPALLFLSVLCARWEEIWPQLEPSLEGHFGPAAYVSDLIPFTQTRYYDEELGTPIYRRVLAFETLLPHDRLAWAKLLTNALERRFTSAGGNRLVNLDPGLVSLERLVLATGKNFTHRIYQGQGIWADLTLIYTAGAWQTLPWTFPDYAGPELQKHLSILRELYKTRLKAEKTAPSLRA